MTHGSLYSGIGGWLLAARWAGIENIFTCEIDDFCNKVLDKHFPDTDRHHDIKETDFTGYAGRVDILTTSDPCQPFSFAGKRGGKGDDRYLWPETVRVIREVKPPFVVFENVPGFIGMAFETVASDLEKEGYTVESFVIPACSIGAWHRRDRLWVIAYSSSTRAGVEKHRSRGQEWKSTKASQSKILRQKDRKISAEGIITDNKDVSDPNNSGVRTSEGGTNENRQENIEGQESKPWTKPCGCSKVISDPNTQRLQGGSCGQIGSLRETKGAFTWSKPGGTITEGWDYWKTEPNVGRVAYGVPNRVDRLKSLGNAVVPQVAEFIGRCILEAERIA